MFYKREIGSLFIGKKCLKYGNNPWIFKDDNRSSQSNKRLSSTQMKSFKKIHY